jgi:four helix bundle protein
MKSHVNSFWSCARSCPPSNATIAIWQISCGAPRTASCSNLSEGQRSLKGNKHKHYAIAHGSANEVRGALDLALAWGWIDEARAAFAKLDRLLRLLWGLTQR